MQTVRRAIAKAGDLAHGLKTPLAILAQEAERLEDRRRAGAGRGRSPSRSRGCGGRSTTTSRTRAPPRRARRRARARRSPSRPRVSRARCGACTPSRGLVDRRDGCRRSTAFRGQREDLDEMLGNLLDNACKWARSRVIVDAVSTDGTLVDHGRRRWPRPGSVDARSGAAARRARRRSRARLRPRPGHRPRSRRAVRRLDRARRTRRSAACART